MQFLETRMAWIVINEIWQHPASKQHTVLGDGKLNLFSFFRYYVLD